MDYDLFVIGGGSGGVRAARLTSQSGKKVALAEGDRMGGTCVIRGCVPKKLMLYASQFPSQVKDAAAYGWDAQIGDLDWPHFHGLLSSELDRLEGVYTTNLGKAGVELFPQFAKIIDANTVELADGTRKTAERILIATGGRPIVPTDIEGSELGLISDDIFHLETLPKKVIIIGGGYIASEFAGILHGLGASVHQICRSKLLGGFDRETVDFTEAGMTARGIKITHNVQATKIEDTGNGRRVHFNNGEVEECDALVFAVGRAANVNGLGLENAGVELTKKGAIAVDRLSQTNIPSIYAIGDVTNRAPLTPVAIREAVAFHSTVYQGTEKTVDYDAIPTAIFTTPEIGTVGLSEEAATEKGLDYQVFASSFRPMNGILAGRTDKMLLKLMVERATDRVIGVHIAGPGAGELIQMAAIPVNMGATKAQFDATIAVHPTAAEELVTMSTPRN